MSHRPIRSHDTIHSIDIMARDPVCGMTVDERTAVRLDTPAGPVYFCCEGCLKAYQTKSGAYAGPKKDGCCHEETTASSCHAPAARLSRQVWMVLALTAGVWGLGKVWPFFAPWSSMLEHYLHRVWWAVLLGLFIGGLIEHTVPRELFTVLLARRRKRTIPTAIALGFLGSLCSHGILALSMQLYRKGASTPAVIAFLLASPWANVSWTLLLFSLFGLRPTLFILLGAVVIAAVTGWIYQLLEHRGFVESNPNTVAVSEDYRPWEDIKQRLRGYRCSLSGLKHDCIGIGRGMIGLANMVMWWVGIGLLLSSLAGAYVPTAWFERFIGPTPLGMAATLGLATVLEICSEGTAPLAFEIHRQTGALGNAFVFLMAGVATDYTEIGLVWINIGRRAALWLPAVTVPQILVWGWMLNRLFS